MPNVAAFAFSVKLFLQAPRPPNFQSVIIADGNKHFLVDGIKSDRVDDACVTKRRHLSDFREASIPNVSVIIFGAARDPIRRHVEENEETFVVRGVGAMRRMKRSQ